jgi:hypothetical protein
MRGSLITNLLTSSIKMVSKLAGYRFSLGTDLFVHLN